MPVYGTTSPMHNVHYHIRYAQRLLGGVDDIVFADACESYRIYIELCLMDVQGYGYGACMGHCCTDPTRNDATCITWYYCTVV